MESLVFLIKDKKDLKSIDDSYVRKRLDVYVKENPKFLEKFENSKNVKQFTKSKEYKAMLKEVRAVLRETYGAFIHSSYGKIKRQLKKLKEEPDIEVNNKILSMHRSSRERLVHYVHVYKKIFKITGKPERILDLACGLNPFSYPYLGCEPEYLCSDIGQELMDYIQEYFDFSGIKGTSFVFDLFDFHENAFSEYAHADVCFLFKALDSLETLERDFSEKLVLDLPADWIVVSFPTQSLGSGRKISDARRTWFERILERNKLEYRFFKIANESFYVVSKGI